MRCFEATMLSLIIAPSLCLAQMQNTESMGSITLFFESLNMRGVATTCTKANSDFAAKFEPAFNKWLNKNSTALKQAERVFLGSNPQDPDSVRMRIVLDDVGKFVRGGVAEIQDEQFRAVIEASLRSVRELPKSQLREICDKLLRQVSL
jgi:hypothetical protein